ITRGIEVGHIFQLGRTYSEKMDCTILDADGHSQTPTMGCYGIGVSRIIAAAIEQNADERGIIWPAAIAPFDIALVSLNMDKSERAAAASQLLYDELRQLGFDVLWDDRNARPGVKFADMELIGIPHRIVISERGLNAGTFEYRARRSSENQNFTHE